MAAMADEDAHRGRRSGNSYDEHSPLLGDNIRPNRFNTSCGVGKEDCSDLGKSLESSFANETERLGPGSGNCLSCDPNASLIWRAISGSGSRFLYPACLSRCRTSSSKINSFQALRPAGRILGSAPCSRSRTMMGSIRFLAT